MNGHPLVRLPALLALVVAVSGFVAGHAAAHDPTPTTAAHHPAAHSTATATAGSTRTVTIRVDGGQRFQIFAGFGGTWTDFTDEGGAIFNRHDPSQPARVSATAADRAGIAALLFEQLGIARVRLFLDGFEPTNDNNDPSVLDPAAFDWGPVVDPRIDLVSLARPLGLLTWWATFALSDPGDAWFRLTDSDCALNPTMIDEFVEWHMAAAQRFRGRGVELPFMAIVNEPDLCGGQQPKIPTDLFVEIVKRLGTRLAAAGLATKLVVTDGWNPENSLSTMRAVLADSEARQYVGALAFHAYSPPYPSPAATLATSGQGEPDPAAVAVREEIRDLAARYDLPVWMSEVCVCTPQGDGLSEFDLGRARLNHLFDELTITNAAAIDVMNLAFIDRPGVNDELVHFYFRPDGTLDRYQVATYGYLVGQIARYAVPDSVRIAADSDDPRVRTVAFARPDGATVVIVLNNTSDVVDLDLQLTGTGHPRNASALTSAAAAPWQTLGVASTENGATASLPPLSLSTIVIG